MTQLVKNPLAMRGTWIRSLGWEDPLEKGKATHSSILAWKFHGLYNPWGHKESIFILILIAAAAKSLQSCPTLCDPIDGSAPGSPVPGIFQARTLEWVAISFSNA